jgi:hypothetical protein
MGKIEARAEGGRERSEDALNIKIVPIGGTFQAFMLQSARCC